MYLDAVEDLPPNYPLPRGSFDSPYHNVKYTALVQAVMKAMK